MTTGGRFVVVSCPGFGQDRFNFHRADPTWANRAGYSIPRAIMWGSGGGELGGGSGGLRGGAV